MTPRVDVLLDKIDEGVAEVRAHYEADLAAKEVSDELLYAVSHVIQDYQAALDWTATAVNKKYGPKQRRPYFPLTGKPTDFAVKLEDQIKGLAAKEPGVAAAFERHQPYQPGRAELGYLHALARVNKHEDFTAQTRQEQRRIEALTGVGRVSWNPAQVTFGPGVSIGGVPVDPSTQRPIPHPSQTVTETIYVDWRFNDPPVSVLPTLGRLARLVREAVEDVCGEAGL
jgi:hypothetical protein